MGDEARDLPVSSACGSGIAWLRGNDQALGPSRLPGAGVRSFSKRVQNRIHRAPGNWRTGLGEFDGLEAIEARCGGSKVMWAACGFNVRFTRRYFAN